MKNLSRAVLPLVILAGIGLGGTLSLGFVKAYGQEEKIVSDEAYRLFEEAKRLQAEGKGADAEEIREKAKRIEAEARAEHKERERVQEKERIVSDDARDLLKEAERLQAEGKPDAAEQLRRRAKDIEAKARDRQKGREGKERPSLDRVQQELRVNLLSAERELDELSLDYGPKHPQLLAARDRAQMIQKQILMDQAERLQAEGQREAAEELREKARRIEVEIREGEKERRERPEREKVAAMEEARHLIAKAEQLEVEAKELRANAKRIQAEARGRIEKERGGEVKKRVEGAVPEEWRVARDKAIEEHLQMAKRLKAEGKPDAAEEHWRIAEEIKRELKARLPKEKALPEKQVRFREEGPGPAKNVILRKPGAPFPPILPEINELRRDMNAMREELTQIRKLLHELVQK